MILKVWFLGKLKSSCAVSWSVKDSLDVCEDDLYLR